MTTASSQFFAILTEVGEAKQANANALGIPWTFAQMGVGDANGTEPIPDRKQTRLINERRRAPLNQVKVDPANANIIIAEQIIPPDVGGWWIREIGLYDVDGDMVAVANCAPSFKPLLTQGTGKTQIVRLNIIVTSTANVQLKIDPSVVLAPRSYVDNLFLNILPPDKVAGTYTKVQINSRGVVVAGDNPTTLSGYGILDAMPKGAGGLLTTPPQIDGPMAALGGTQFVSVGSKTTDKPSEVDYGAGFHIKYPDSNYSLELLGGVTNNWLGFRRVDDQGNGTWRAIYHSGNFDPKSKADVSSTLAGYGIGNAYTMTETNNLLQQVATALTNDKANKATSLDGYSIAKASQSEAEAGVDDTKAMTPLRVFQAIAKLVKQATEATSGLLKVATQAQVDAGTADNVAVTPRKLRWGFTFATGRVGYVIFPSYLGGLILQWQNTPVSPDADIYVYFPIPYPREVFMVNVTCDYTQGSGVLDYHASGIIDNSRFIFRSRAGASAAGFAFSVGC